jgi:hypothetical protein
MYHYTCTYFIQDCIRLGVFDIQMFNLSFVHDFETLSLLEAQTGTLAECGVTQCCTID